MSGWITCASELVQGSARELCFLVYHGHVWLQGSVVEFLVEHKSDLQAGLKHCSLNWGCPRHMYIYIHMYVYIYIYTLCIDMDSRL